MNPEATGVPLTIITGFLGAGKTTLLNRLLNGGHGLRVAVLVNDFGSVNIDAELIVGVQDDMISLANGCVCCEIRDDLIDAVDKVLGEVPAPEYIVLEASGVADPAGIWATFNDPAHRDLLRLDSVTCVVDTEQIFSHLDEAPGLLMLKARQIGFADLVILNKVDLASEDQLRWVRYWIDEMMDRVRVVEATHCDVPLEILLGSEDDLRVVHSLDEVDDDRLHSDHGTQFDTFLYETDRPFSEHALRDMVSRELPGSVYRCKGFVHLDDGRTWLLQVVGRRTQLTSLATTTQPAYTRLVAIGVAGDIDRPALHAAFDGCLSA